MFLGGGYDVGFLSVPMFLPGGGVVWSLEVGPKGYSTTTPSLVMTSSGGHRSGQYQYASYWNTFLLLVMI